MQLGGGQHSCICVTETNTKDICEIQELSIKDTEVWGFYSHLCAECDSLES
jgi:hypothetical protein